MNEFLWTERYRPTKVQDIILPPALKKTFSDIVKNGNMHNMIFTGTAGLGKTTVAKALCNELGLDYLYVNASEESGIDVLRNKIRTFASSVSLNGGYKVIILDEADYLNAQSTQPALRGFIEEFSSNCRFIFTCNFKHKIIEPLHSRCAIIDFTTDKKQLAKLAEEFMQKRLIPLLKLEGVTYTQSVLVELIIKHAPDWRRVINECQRHSTSGTISSDILVGLSNQSIAELVQYLKAKDFKSMRAWVVNHTNADDTGTFRAIYDNIALHAQPQSIPQAVILIAEYSYKSAFMSDKELNLTACLTELMASINWK